MALRVENAEVKVKFQYLYLQFSKSNKLTWVPILKTSIISTAKQQLLPENAIQELKAAVKGEVIIRGDGPEEVYRAAIDRWNKAWIQEAALIVFCETDEDVAASLNYVQKWDLEMTISAGRHSYYGASSTTGLVIDLRKMRKVEIDLESKSGTAQGGFVAADIEQPLGEKGYVAVFGAINDTGIGGLTLGGGTGYLTGQYGMTIDNLLSAKMVLADGTIVTASDESNPDLFWGIRGGGSNFGVVTEFTYKIHEHKGDVFFGTLAFSAEKTSKLLGIIETLRQDIESADGKLAWFLAMARFPGQPRVHPLMLLFYDGPEEEGKKFLVPVLALEPFMNQTTMKPYSKATDPIPSMSPDHNRVSSSNATLASPLELSVIESLIKDLDAFFNKYGDAVTPSRVVIELRSYKASAAVNPSATAYRSRGETIFVIMEAVYNSSVSNEAIRQDVKTIMDKVKASKRQKDGKSQNLFNLNVSGGLEKAKDAYGENYPRLKELKRNYDPSFVFNKWYPISPTAE